MTVLAMLPESSQRVLIKKDVIEHMARYRQLSWYAREAGGQLFGTVSSSEIVISMATGPYRGDQRWRSSYRSNPQLAQAAINQQAKTGLLYMGEWHTHPEDHPTASSTDLDAVGKLQRASKTRLSNLLMVIQGRVVGHLGLALYSFGADGFTRWVVQGGPATE